AEGPEAELRLIGVRVSRVTTPAELSALVAGIPRSGPIAGGAYRLQALVERIVHTDSTEGSDFRAAELARDSLHAPALAAGLFEAFARNHPASLFAPKALLAAAVADPERGGTVQATLDSAYPRSPYLLAARGAPSPAYAIAEDSLSRLLGITPTGLATASGPARWDPPRTGPRGPDLDPVPVRVPAVTRRVTPAGRTAAPRIDRP
ncbi:MAG TPA: hypothetical protein VI160_03580, partial [Gemmatimonadales bacterium]